MRADRLVATLLLLQSKGTITAAQLAEELEISERTARRDLDALGAAGVPIYSQRGRGGGWRLVGGARTDLTGLHSPEARALMTMAAATGQATPAFSSAVRKLMQALPDPVRMEAERAAQSVLADDSGWGNPNSLLAESNKDYWVEPLQSAVMASVEVDLRYNTPRKGVSNRIVQPYGLVIKRGTWYLLAQTAVGMRSFRLDRVVAVSPTTTTFTPRDDFDLETEWQAITASYTEQSSQLRVTAIAANDALGILRGMGVETTAVMQRSDGRWDVTLGSWNAEILAAKLAGIISRIELVDPPTELTQRLLEMGTELTARFGAGQGVQAPTD